MNFLYPAFLFALFAISIPILIHLFNFRRYKRVYFTNVQFLKEVKRQTTSTSRLKHLLVLLSRILAISFLIFAFAQPYIPQKAQMVQKGKRGVSIYVDNSFSMGAHGQDIALLEDAKLKAKQIADAYKLDDQFQLITNEFSGTQQRLLNKEELDDLIDEIDVVADARKISEVILRQVEALDGSDAGSKVIYVISDFQQSILDFEHIAIDTGIALYFIPVQAARPNNVFIDSCWFLSPILLFDQVNELVVKIKNAGDEEIENSRLTLKIDDQIKALSDFTLEPYGSVYDTIFFTINKFGWHQAEVSIMDYPITFDDAYYFAFDLAKNISILSISSEQEEGNAYLNAMFRGDNYFLLKNTLLHQLDYATLSGYQLIILNGLKAIPSGLAQQLKKYMESGGSVLIFPDLKLDNNSYNTFLRSVGANTFVGIDDSLKKVKWLNLEHELFKGVFEKVPKNIDLPQARYHFIFSSNTRSTEEVLLKFSDGSSFFSAYVYKDGKLYLVGSPLDPDHTDLPIHSIFVPMLYKIAIIAGKVNPKPYTLGRDNVVEAGDNLLSKETLYRIKIGASEFIPEHRVIGNKLLLMLHDHIKRAGIFHLYLPDKDYSRLLAFNYDRTESDFSYMDNDEFEQECAKKNIILIQSVAKNLAHVIEELERGVTLWKVCIILALIFFGVEIVLLRFWKNL
ncbi:MAG: BatA and WFA domain-containing protein [Bacteroidetes bacterium]|nr:BatA and WFA domain-containing protein [Bacteroidota bacterium]